jgi:flagellar hook-basal body complex protein FliE
MTTASSILVTPSAAVDAYKRSVQSTSGNAAGSFGSAMDEALNQAQATGKIADAQAMKAVSGEANLTEVVTALSHAEVTLQTVTAIRDRVIQAYQDIMKMPI